MAAVSGKTGSVNFTGGYTTNAHKWDATDSTELLDTTAFNPTGGRRTYTTGLSDMEVAYECYLDDTTALPTSGASGSAAFTAATSRQYSGTFICSSAKVGVSADGGSRIVTITGKFNGVVTPA